MDSNRRSVLAAAAVPHLAAMGVDGMTLRPLAEALGTSDRMLIYHFGSREGLVEEVLRRAFNDLGEQQRGPSSGGGGAGRVVRSLWDALSSEEARPAVQVYLQASALAGHRENWRTMLHPLTNGWLEEIARRLESEGIPADRAGVVASVVSATLDGLLLRLLLNDDRRELGPAVEALAATIEAEGSASGRGCAAALTQTGTGRSSSPG